MTPDPNFDAALAHHGDGRLHEAEKLYRQILERNPGHADALHMLGVIAHQSGQHVQARELIAGSIALQPGAPDAFGNLGLVLQALGEKENAIKSYQRALALAPDRAEFHNRLGSALNSAGKLDEAIVQLESAIRLDPNLAGAHNNLGNAYQAAQRHQEAISSYRRALSLRADHVEAMNNLANSLRETGEFADAIHWYQKALSLRPDHPEVLVHLADALEERRDFTKAIDYRRRSVQRALEDFDALIRLGNTLMKAGISDEAISTYTRAALLNPKSPVAQFDLGCALHAGARPDQAIACFREALTLEPAFAAAANNLGSALKDAGQLDQALAAYEQALAIQGDYREAADNLIYARLFHPAVDIAGQTAELARWNHRYADPVAHEHRPHANVRSADRPLRIGYISPDFRDHVVGRNVLPVLERHDRGRFETFIYANVQHPDALTERFRAASHAWRDINRVPDSDVADMIRRDGIDILVDLALHMAHNRLPIFARKPAPVQMTWAGYPGTTGMPAIQYRISDSHLDPPGTDEDAYSEKTVLLSHSFWCYDLLGIELKVSPLPADASGKITFGCLNNFCKLNDSTLSLWSQLLRAVPASTLRLLAPEGSARRHVLEVLGANGVASGRVVFHSLQPRLDYLRLYDQIDIALDTFPYNGHTTSLDALWMGVPLITIAGVTPVSRAGVSQLTNVGLPDLIGDSGEQFVQIGVALAHDRERLRTLRATLRHRLERSPIMDAAKFTADLEALYGKVWSAYCAAG